MKKLALALVASTIVAGAASAHTIGSGFYAGAAVGYGATVIKGSAGQIGSDNGSIGIYTGYGWVSGCTYFGGELSGNLENFKFKISDLDTTNNNTGNVYQVTRNGNLNAAIRMGYIVTPSTMIYLRLGANFSKYKTSTTPFVAGVAGTGTSKSTSSFGIEPGVGLETALQKNVYLRGQYTYEFAKLKWSGNSPKVRAQSFKLGLSYKF